MLIALRYEGGTNYSFCGFFDSEDEASAALKSDGCVLDWTQRKEVQIEAPEPTKTLITPQDGEAQKPESVLEAEQD